MTLYQHQNYHGKGKADKLKYLGPSTSIFSQGFVGKTKQFAFVQFLWKQGVPLPSIAGELILDQPSTIKSHKTVRDI